MYTYFKGQVKAIHPPSITFEVNNIGYEVIVASPYNYTQSVRKIFIYQHVKEDELSLYGFETNDDKKMFLDLISVKGIGPKTALAVLAAGTVSYIRNAITNEDIDYLQKFPKIGKKAAQQIVIDLAGKYTQELKTDEFKVDDNDTLAALEALGYKRAEIMKILKTIDQTLSTEQKIKEVLQKMVS